MPCCPRRPGCGERGPSGPQRPPALPGPGRRRGRPLPEAAAAGRPGSPRTAAGSGPARTVERTRAAGGLRWDLGARARPLAGALRLQPHGLRRGPPKLLYKARAVALIRPRQRAETPPGGSGRARGAGAGSPRTPRTRGAGGTEDFAPRRVTKGGLINCSRCFNKRAYCEPTEDLRRVGPR